MDMARRYKITETINAALEHHEDGKVTYLEGRSDEEIGAMFGEKAHTIGNIRRKVFGLLRAEGKGRAASQQEVAETIKQLATVADALTDTAAAINTLTMRILDVERRLADWSKHYDGRINGLQDAITARQSEHSRRLDAFHRRIAGLEGGFEVGEKQ